MDVWGFRARKTRLRPHVAGCQISNLCVVHFSVTNLMWLTYRLMHDSDLFTLQSIQCIPFWWLPRTSTRVAKDRRSFFCGRSAHMLGVNTQPATQEVMSLKGSQSLALSKTSTAQKRVNGPQSGVICEIKRKRGRSFICVKPFTLLYLDWCSV